MYAWQTQNSKNHCRRSYENDRLYTALPNPISEIDMMRNSLYTTQERGGRLHQQLRAESNATTAPERMMQGHFMK